MDALALLLSRLQFAFTASFHIIYHPSPFARGLGLTILEALHLATCRPIVFESGSRFSVWRSILERDQGDRKWYERSSYTLEQTMRRMCSKARLTRTRAFGRGGKRAGELHADAHRRLHAKA